jgi:hypothetical protein
MWCSTSVPTGGQTLEGHTTSSNSARNAFSHSGDSSGCVGGLAALSAAVSPPQLPADFGDGGDRTALAEQEAAVETVAKDCSDSVTTRRLAAGSTSSLWMRKKSNPLMAKVTSARRNVYSNWWPWKSSWTALSLQHSIRWPFAPVRFKPLGSDMER